MKRLYVLAALAGTVVPLALFLPWVQAHGLAVFLLTRSAFGNPVSAFAWADVLISGVVLVIFMLHDSSRRRVPYLWLPFVGLFTVGVSCALPLFLALREHGRGASDAA
ncbi:MAG: hypothetical protein RIQ53_3354 [Pseudomonadota bacterium]|jgi:hypothetical protein